MALHRSVLHTIVISERYTLRKDVRSRFFVSSSSGWPHRVFRWTDFFLVGHVAVEVGRWAPTCGARRIMAKPKLAWSESSAATSVHAHPDARITTAGPIAPDRLRRELAHSRRGGGRIPSRKASFRRAEPGGAQRPTSNATARGDHGARSRRIAVDSEGDRAGGWACPAGFTSSSQVEGPTWVSSGS